MKDLAFRLAALDPDASAALRVIAHFDQLSSTRVGLSTIVGEAAKLAGWPARLIDDDRRLSVRVEPDGAARPLPQPAAPDWLFAPLPGERAARLWLEHPGPASPVEAMVLERAAAAAAAVLFRTGGGLGQRAAAADPAWVELVVDAAVPEADRLRAARRLGLTPTTLARAVAVPGAAPYLETVPPAGVAPYHTQRAGIGRTVAVPSLPASWVDAQTAVRFTAHGTAVDPGPRIVAYEELGGLALLAAGVGPATEPVPDVSALSAVAATAPWVLPTLAAVADATSLRAAATSLRVHHSTLQDRIATVERQLGWTVRDARGRLRLQLALTLRRLQRRLD